MDVLYRKIIKAGAIAGTLDILAAFTYYYLKTGQTNFFNVLKFIASGLYGKEAFAGGAEMILAGLAIHYLIAFSFTIFFFVVFPYIKIMSRSIILTAVLYGIFVWTIMNIIVVPMSNIASRPLTIEGILINAMILVACIGLPLSWIGNAYYAKRSR
jgi:hypothetical protein